MRRGDTWLRSGFPLRRAFLEHWRALLERVYDVEQAVDLHNRMVG